MQQDLAEATNLLLHQLRRNAGYMARQEVARLVEPIAADHRRLEPFGYKVYSQNDEDGIIEEIFRRLNISSGVFAEIGVENGLECNTLYLLHKGWRGLWIEGNIRQRGFIENKFSAILHNRRLKVLFEMVNVQNVNILLSRVGANLEIDFLSIDIDGNDIYLIDALTLTPKVICIEYNSKFPPHVAKRPVYRAQHAWQGTDYMGASLLSVDEAAKAKGYRLVGTNITGANAFFVRSDLAADGLFASDVDLPSLYNPPRYWLTSDLFGHAGHMADFGPYVDLA